MSNIKIYNPKTFEAGYKLYVEQRSGLMKIRNWLVTLDTNWTLHIFKDTDPTIRDVYGKDWVMEVINEVIMDNFYTEEQREILTAIRTEYIYNASI